MLVAHTLTNQRIEASEVDKNIACFCPECNEVVILKTGKIKIPHFAHLPNSNCEYGRGETLAHMEAKLFFKKQLAKLYNGVELEKHLPHINGDRRADIFFLSKNGFPSVIEVQHSTISLDLLEARVKSYALQNIAQMWVIVAKEKHFERFYKPTKMEEYLCTLNNGCLYYYFNGQLYFTKHHFTIDCPENAIHRVVNLEKECINCAWLQPDIPWKYKTPCPLKIYFRMINNFKLKSYVTPAYVNFKAVIPPHQLIQFDV